MDYGTSQYIVAAPLLDAGVYQPRSLENPNLQLNDPAAWAEVFGDQIGTDAGLSVGWKQSLGYSPVWAAVNLLSGDVAKLPLELFHRIEASGANGREPAKSHPAYRLVRRQANDNLSAFTLWRRVMSHLLLWNRAFVLIERDGMGRAVGLLNLLPDRTTLQHGGNGQVGIVTEIDGQREAFALNDVLFFEGISPFQNEPIELIKQARNAFALGLAAEKFSSKFFSNGAQTGGILEVPAAFTRKAADKLEEGFRRRYSGLGAAFKTVILREGAKFHATQVEPDKAQLSELRAEQIRDVARWFGIPPHKLGDSSRVSYNSLEQENQSYLDTALSHWLSVITNECWLKLLSGPEKESDRYYFEHNTQALLRADTETTMTVLMNGIQWGILSPNEARAKLNMNPRDGGDAFLTPLNMTAGDNAGPRPEQQNSLRNAVLGGFVAAVNRGLESVIETLESSAKKKTRSRYLSWLESAEQSLATRVRGIVTTHGQATSEATGIAVEQLEQRAVEMTVTMLVAACRERLKTETGDIASAVKSECDAARRTVRELLPDLLDRGTKK